MNFGPEIPPPYRLLFGELRVVRDWARARMFPQTRGIPVASDGQPVITIPGFMAGDYAMKQMRLDLATAGFEPHGWGMGVNRGAKANTLSQLDVRVAAIHAQTGRKVALIGWSLGGFYAREYAKYHPEYVSHVVTLGTPFSGSRKANHAWRAYRVIAGHSVENPPIAFHPDTKPPMPTYAIWSPRDGVVAPPCAAGLPRERDAAIRIDIGHLGMAYDPDTIDIIIQLLSGQRVPERQFEIG